jgi:uncharacterized membrane protein YbhN (UPF0104 family)
VRWSRSWRRPATITVSSNISRTKDRPGSRRADRLIALTSFTALSLGHTVGLAALSSGTVRYRFYSKLGLGEGEVARIVIFSATTVALGLLSVAGAAGAIQPVDIGAFVGLPTWLAATLGGLALLAVVAYVVFTARVGGSVRILGRTLRLPSARVAALQVAVGCTNYLLVAATLHALLGEDVAVSFLSFASLYAVANVLGILSHVPGGLGVLEAVVLAALPHAGAVSALIAFRVVYYLVPFLLGATTYAAFELLHVNADARRSSPRSRRSGGDRKPAKKQA